MTIQSSKVIFQALEISAASLTSMTSATSLASTASTALVSQKLFGPDCLIILATKMTNTGPLVWIGSSKIQFFTDIWYPFFQRLLRPTFAIFLKIG